MTAALNIRETFPLELRNFPNHSSFCRCRVSHFFVAHANQPYSFACSQIFKRTKHSPLLSLYGSDLQAIWPGLSLLTVPAPKHSIYVSACWDTEGLGRGSSHFRREQSKRLSKASLPGPRILQRAHEKVESGRLRSTKGRTYAASMSRLRVNYAIQIWESGMRRS